MKTTIIAAVLALAIGASTSPVFAEPDTSRPVRTAAKAKPGMPKSSEGTSDEKSEGTSDEKSECLTNAGFSEANTPKEYTEAKEADEDAKVFYISGSGKVTLPLQHVAAAVQACGAKLGARR